MFVPCYLLKEDGLLSPPIFGGKKECWGEPPHDECILMVDNGGANNKAKPNHKIKLSSRLIIRNLSSFKNGSYVVKYKLMHDPEPQVIRIIRFSWSLINNHWHYLFTLMWSSTLVRRNKNTPKNIQSTITITTTMNTATIYWYDTKTGEDSWILSCDGHRTIC